MYDKDEYRNIHYVGLVITIPIKGILRVKIPTLKYIRDVKCDYKVVGELEYIVTLILTLIKITEIITTLIRTRTEAEPTIEVITN